MSFPVSSFDTLDIAKTYMGIFRNGFVISCAPDAHVEKAFTI